MQIRPRPHTGFGGMRLGWVSLELVWRESKRAGTESALARVFTYDPRRSTD